MSLPSQMKKLLENMLVEITQNPQHVLKREQRDEVLHTFQNLQTDLEIESQASTYSYLALGWLGVLTCSKILPIWEQAIQLQELMPYQQSLPREMLEMAENILLNKVLLEEARIQYGTDFYLLPLGIKDKVLRQQSSVLDCNYILLGMLLYTRTPLFPRIADITVLARDVWAGTDTNQPGLWNNPLIITIYEILSDILNDDYTINVMNGDTILQLLQANKEKVFYDDIFLGKDLSILQNFAPFQYDARKELEFWTWWMTEAVPQAWELVQTL